MRYLRAVLTLHFRRTCHSVSPVKFLAMFMVVYWHVISYRPGFELSSRPSYAANFIIAVNMPLFFMVSGFFSRHLHESGNWAKLAARLKLYFWPVVVFSLSNRFVELDAGVLTVFLASCGIFALCFLMVRVLKMSNFVKKGIFGK